MLNILGKKEALEFMKSSARNNSWPLVNFTQNPFGWPNLLYIFNGMAINNLQNVLSLRIYSQFLTLVSTTVSLLFCFFELLTAVILCVVREIPVLCLLISLM